MALDITKIPRIMRTKGWLNGARLMETWLSRPSAVAPVYGPPDTATIRMDSWVLSFARARQVYHQIVADRIWVNQPAQARIVRLLRRKGLLTGARRSFGNLTVPANLQDPDYANQRAVKVGLLDLDDMTAALGTFALRVAIAGHVDPLPGRPGHQITVTGAGVYVRDSYDFDGAQFLGFWDDSDNSVSMTNPLSGTAVSNEDFRKWRARTGRGGDFLVYADVKRIPLKGADSFLVP